MQRWIILCLILFGKPGFANSKFSSCGLKARQLFERTKNSYSIQRLVSKYTQLKKVDRRLAWLKLAEKFDSLEEIDNLSSPAILHHITIKKRFPGEVEDYLKNVNEKPSVVLPLLENEGITLTDFQREFIGLIEKKYRIGAEIAFMAYKQKNMAISEEKWRGNYYDNLLAFLNRTIDEISAKDTNSVFFPPHLSNVLHSRSFAKDLPNTDLFQLPSDDMALFDESFLSRLADDIEIEKGIEKIAQVMGQILEEMPVGISLRPAEAINTVRLGNWHYYGYFLDNWIDKKYKKISRQGYEKGRPEILVYSKISQKVGPMAAKVRGVMDIEFNASNHKKKIIATLLDKTHRNLDLIEDFSHNPNKKCLHTCGSFPYYIMFKAGIPIIFPIYLSPESGMAALAVQKALKFPNVKTVQFSKFTKEGILVGTTVASLHGIGKLVMEAGFYYIAVATVVNYFISDDGSDE